MPDVPLRMRAGRLLVVLFLLIHGTTVTASLAHEHPTGAQLRKVFRLYESLVGVYQNWDMFAPGPPRRDTWMEVVALDAAGGRTPLPPLQGERADRTIEWRYQRTGKLERNLLGKKRKSALRAYARWLCQEHPEAARIEVIRVQQRSPTMQERRDGVATEASRETARSQQCR
jgi:hypothetical protein